MVFAITKDKNLGVAYLPDNSSITLDMTAFSGQTEGKWYNPSTGIYTAISGTIDNSGTHSFARPGTGDWILLLVGS